MLYIIRDFTAESLFFDSFTDVEQYSIMNVYMAKKKIINTKKKNAINLSLNKIKKIEMLDASHQSSCVDNIIDKTLMDKNLLLAIHLLKFL